MRVYDTFMFRCEFEVLRIRLEELWDVVDVFVLVEADRTHRGDPKVMEFTENAELFAPWAEKIRVVRVQDGPTTGNAWVRENFQRNAILRGLWDAEPEDVVLISDADEIPRPEIVRQLPGLLRDGDILGFQQTLYYYSLNWRSGLWGGTRAVRRSTLDTVTPQTVRESATEVVVDAGWHFSYLAPQDEAVSYVIDKVKAFAHEEYDDEEFLDEDYLRQCVAQGYRFCDDGGFTPMAYEAVGPTHPQSVQRRLAELGHLISEAPDPTLPPPAPRTLKKPHSWAPVYDTEPVSAVPAPREPEVEPLSAPVAPPAPVLVPKQVAVPAPTPSAVPGTSTGAAPAAAAAPGAAAVPAARHCGLCGRRPEPAGAWPARCSCGAVLAAPPAPRSLTADAAGSLLDTFVLPMLREAPAARLLDVAAGDGTFVAAARAAGLDCLGLVPEREAARAAAERGVPVLVGDVALLPTSSFDVVTLWHGLRSLHDPVGVLRDVARVLAPGGRLVLRADESDVAAPAGEDPLPEVLARAVRLAGFDEPALVHQGPGVCTALTRAPRAADEIPLPRRGARPPVSIVALTWNACETTDTFLTWLRDTVGPDDEVIVVDNGSVDGTAEVLARHDWVRVVWNSTNEGFARGCNIGAAQARHPFVVFLNNDTLPVPGWIEGLVAPFDDPEVGATGPMSNAVSGVQLVDDPTYDPQSPQDVVHHAQDVARWGRGHRTATHRLVGFCLAVRRELFEQIGGFDEGFGLGGCEDDDLGLRLVCAGWRLLVVHDTFVHHIGHATFEANGTDWFGLQQENVRRLQDKLGALPPVSVVVSAGQDAAALARTVVSLADAVGGLSVELVVVCADEVPLRPVLELVQGQVTVVEAAAAQDHESAWRIGRAVGRGARRALLAAGEEVDLLALSELLVADPLDAVPVRCGTGAPARR